MSWASRSKEQASANAAARINFSPVFKRLLLAIAVCNGLIGIKRIIEPFFSSLLFKKDFLQEYLMAKALLHGINPYLPVPELAKTFFNEADYGQILNYCGLRHPTPHPPFVGLLSLPFALLNYRAAALVWLGLSLGCVLLAIYLLWRWAGQPLRPSTVALAFIIALGCGAVIEDLWLGQITLWLLVLLLGAWLALQRRKMILAGALLGVAFAIKLAAWPIILFLALRRKWAAVSAAGVVAIAANLSAMTVVGWAGVKDYYLKIGPQVAALYRSHDGNYSAWTWGERFFAGYGYNIWVTPLWPSPTFARLLAYLLPLLVLVIGLWLAGKAESIQTSFALLVCVGILVSPIAWSHYTILTVIPLALVVRWLRQNEWPRTMTHTAFGLWFLLMIPGTTLARTALLFSSRLTPDGTPIVPILAGLFTLVDALALGILFFLLWRLDQNEASLGARTSTRSHSEDTIKLDALVQVG